MEKTSLYLAIEEFLISKGFSAPNESCPAFRCKMVIPGREMIINGRHVTEPSRLANFNIIPLGAGAILDIDNAPICELQGYNMLDNDFWVDSLKDFMFWLEQIMRATNLPVGDRQ